MYLITRSGVHMTCRIPSATVPRWSPAKLPSRKSATICSRPVVNTCCGIFWLVANDCPGSVTRPRARPILNSSSPMRLASMMNPRSAPVASMAESITSSSTSSSTRADPSARSESSSVEICLKSMTPEVWLRRESVESSSRNTSSALPLRPNRIRSRCFNGRSVTCSSFTNVPYREPRSFNTYLPSSPSAISACSRDTSTLAGRKSLSLLRPMRNTGLSMTTTRRPSVSSIWRRGALSVAVSVLTAVWPSARQFAPTRP